MARPLLLHTEDSAYLAQEVHDLLGAKKHADIDHFEDIYFPSGEYKPEAPHVRGRHVYIFHSPVIKGGNFPGYNPDSFYVHAAFLDDAVRRSILPGDCFIGHVAPHMPYQRQERQAQPRTPISTRRLMQLFYMPPHVGTLLITFDMHADAIAGQADFQIDQLYASSLLLGDLKNRNDVVLVAPDVGAAKRVRHVSKKLFGHKKIVIIDKDRPADSEVEVAHVVGPELVKGNVAYMFDDMIDTGGTIVEGANALREAGATDVYAACTHPIFSVKDGLEAEERLRKAKIKTVVTNTIYRDDGYLQRNKDWLTVVSVADKIARAI